MKKHILAPTHTLDELLKAKNKSSDLGQKLRLRAIINIKKGKLIKEVSEELLVDRKSISIWQNIYNEKGIEGLKTNKGGRPEGNPKWDASIFNDLAKEIDKGGYWSIPRMQEWLRTNKNKDIPEQTIWYRMDQLQYSYKSARPHPVKGDKEKQESFKKGVSFRSSRH